ncbi:FAD-dependent oxidoreductase [Bacillus carboniphilus]|uniref:FAD-dependent oxidoreductase n=1 Tax=Bacillus carboniphilus TaxID=86663 RepID=A0ABY9JVZ1_9BACI|nr:FAD-dependent oxidoreductase [Bacillus carboniphilus]WLR42959.1 FAD-dependent oxidoreductase [Bacillus carboniphilus]
MLIHAITDDRLPVSQLAKKIEDISQKVDGIQIREKKKSDQQWRTLLNMLLERGVQKEKLIINHRLNIAMEFGINQIHLPINSYQVEEAKKINPNFTIGVSVHSKEEARNRLNEKIDYLYYGNVFKTSCKPGKKGKGNQSLEEIVQISTVPIFAIGGIDHQSIPKINQKKVAGVAVRSFIFSSIDPVSAILLLKGRGGTSLNFDLGVIGGGIIGQSIAYQLAKEGLKVVVFDNGQLQSQATNAAAGMLGVHTENEEQDLFYDFCRESRDLLPLLSEELYEETGIDIEHVQTGMYRLSLQEQERDSFKGLGARVF